ncbi:hypothetical protein Tco_0362792 [Tanacetum coccineum]
MYIMTSRPRILVSVQAPFRGVTSVDKRLSEMIDILFLLTIDLHVILSRQRWTIGNSKVVIMLVVKDYMVNLLMKMTRWMTSEKERLEVIRNIRSRKTIRSETTIISEKTIESEKNRLKVKRPFEESLNVEENMGFDLDVIPYHIREHPLYQRVAREAFKNFMIKGIDDEFNFLPKEPTDDPGTGSLFISINIETPATVVEPLNTVDPSHFSENMADSEDSPSTNKDVVLVSAFVAENTKDQKVTIPLKTSGKRKQTAPTPSTRTTRQKTQKHSTRGSKAASLRIFVVCADFPKAKELKDAKDYHWVVSHVTPPSWKVRADCDAIQERGKIKDRGYVEFEAKCNATLEDLEKNPLVLDLREEIKTLQGQVDKMHGEYNRLVLEEKKWFKYE